MQEIREKIAVLKVEAIEHGDLPLAHACDMASANTALWGDVAPEEMFPESATPIVQFVRKIRDLAEAAEAAEAAITTAAIAAWHAGDPDGTTVRMRAAWRDLSCKQSGPEVFRRVWYPGKKADEWPDCDRLPAIGIRAADRRCSERCDVPVGTLVTTFERAVYHGRRGKCSVEFHLVGADEKGAAVMIPCTHRSLRSRPVYEISLPDGTKIEVTRFERG